MTIKTDLLPLKVLNFLKISLFLMFLLGTTACTNVLPSCGACTSPPLSDLNGTWDLIRWNNPPDSNGAIRIRTIPTASNGKQLFINFDLNNNKVNGFSGCNNFVTSVTEDQRGIRLGEIASTRMMCQENRLMELETNFLYQLKDYRSLKIEKNQLLLLGRDGDALVFTRRNLK
jgi:heat shock protein HslJ